jgi:hypothetical protein
MARQATSATPLNANGLVGNIPGNSATAGQQKQHYRYRNCFEINKRLMEETRRPRRPLNPQPGRLHYETTHLRRERQNGVRAGRTLRPAKKRPVAMAFCCG